MRKRTPQTHPFDKVMIGHKCTSDHLGINKVGPYRSCGFDTEPSGYRTVTTVMTVSLTTKRRDRVDRWTDQFQPAEGVSTPPVDESTGDDRRQPPLGRQSESTRFYAA